MEWGQGHRGAAGYQDHGSSELSLDSGVLVGGGTREWSAPQSGSEGMRCHEVQVAEWPAFCLWFSNNFRGLAVTAESPQGVLGHNRPLGFISAHVLENGVGALTIAMKTGSRLRRLNVTDATHLRMYCKSAGSPTELRIVTASGDIVLRFTGRLDPPPDSKDTL
jgi:hypothetical protein